MLNVADLKIVAETLNVEFPTNEQVLASVRVFNALMDVGNGLKQPMLTIWAASNYQQYNSIAYARHLK